MEGKTREPALGHILAHLCFLDPACQHTHDLQVRYLFYFPMAPFLPHQTCLVLVLVQAEGRSAIR